MECVQLSVYDTLKVRLNEQGRIIFADDAFLKFTGLSIDDLVGEPFKVLFEKDFQEGGYDQMIFPYMVQKKKFYFLMSGRMKDGKCYWGIVRSSQYYTKGSQQPKFLIEIKMLPEQSAEMVADLFGKLIEIKRNAGAEYAIKYFQGYLEENGMNFENFALKVLGIKEKKLDKYFQI